MVISSKDRSWHRPHLARTAGLFLLSYFVVVLFYRYGLRGIHGAMDMLWACNVALLLASYGMFAQDAGAIAGAVAMISMAHFLWMLDVGLYLTMGKFSIGLASYLIWPTTGQFEILTTLHHVWFIPLCFAVLYKNGRLTLHGWRLSLYAALVLVTLCRFATPLRAGDVYLNINMAHEFWEDVEVPFLHAWDPPSTPWPFYAAFTLAVSSALNTLLYLFWRQLHYLHWPAGADEEEGAGKQE